jgi:hypothetical protein
MIFLLYRMLKLRKLLENHLRVYRRIELKNFRELREKDLL